MFGWHPGGGASIPGHPFNCFHALPLENSQGRESRDSALLYSRYREPTPEKLSRRSSRFYYSLQLQFIPVIPVSNQIGQWQNPSSVIRSGDSIPGHARKCGHVIRRSTSCIKLSASRSSPHLPPLSFPPTPIPPTPNLNTTTPPDDTISRTHHVLRRVQRHPAGPRPGPLLTTPQSHAGR